MTDTAIPLPEDGEPSLATSMNDLVDAARERVAKPFVEVAGRVAAVYGRAWRHLMEAAAMRGRVHAAMPRLTMRQVMVHGLVPYRTDPTHDYVKEN